jgi:hypothetical protein
LPGHDEYPQDLLRIGGTEKAAGHKRGRDA